MKKRFVMIVALALAMLMILSACGGNNNTPATFSDVPSTQPAAQTQAPAPSAEPAPPAGTPYALKLATGGTSGTYYGFCGVIAQTLNDKLPNALNITAESTGASLANIQLLEAGENNLAIVQNDVMYYAYTGTTMFTESVTDFSAVISCYPEEIQIVADPSITSIEDLKGKVISVGASDSGTRFNAEQILEAYGISFADCNITFESFADSVDSLKNGAIDAAFVTAGAPTTAVTELATSFTFNILEVDDEHIAKLQENYGFYAKVTIPGGTYTGIADDVQTVAVMATIVAANDVPDETVYAFLDGLFEYQEDIAAAHAKGKLLKLDTAISGIAIPFHPGAVSYYAEQGKNVA